MQNEEQRNAVFGVLQQEFGPANHVITSLCKPRRHTARHTDCDAFRERRLHSAASNIEDLSTWTDQLLVDLDAVTASIPTTEDHPAIDSRLAHLWAARTGLTNRWQKQRHNRRLRRRIAHLDSTVEQHTTVLARQQWEQLCSELSGQLGCKQSWHLLRHLLDPASAKSVARQQLQRVVRVYPGDTPSLMADLAANACFSGSLGRRFIAYPKVKCRHPFIS
ncbi:hypothetical protein MTO96_012715 [Rhipicephalus appendiculatus]